MKNRCLRLSRSGYRLPQQFVETFFQSLRYFRLRLQPGLLNHYLSPHLEDFTQKLLTTLRKSVPFQLRRYTASRSKCAKHN